MDTERSEFCHKIKIQPFILDISRAIHISLTVEGLKDKVSYKAGSVMIVSGLFNAYKTKTYIHDFKMQRYF